MKLLEEIRNARDSARLSGDRKKVVVLATLVGEIETATLRGTAPTDANVVKRIKKFVEDNMAYLALKEDQDRLYENSVYAEFLPEDKPQLTEAELREFIEKLPLEKATMKDIMAALKEKHDGAFDGKMASKIAKEYV